MIEVVGGRLLTNEAIERLATAELETIGLLVAGATF